jgi:serine/threonine-protein kinase ATR
MDVDDDDDDEGSESVRSAKWKAHVGAAWETRYELLAPSLKYRDPVLALRRVLLSEAGLRNDVSHNWLLYAKLTRKEGYLRTSNSAVMHAEALDNQYAQLERAKLLVRQDRMHEALQILEPVDINPAKLDFNVDDPRYCAKNLLLATNWMQQSGQRQGQKVVERYEAVIKFDPTWEKGYFFLARYYEYLLNVKRRELAERVSGNTSSADGATGNATPVVDAEIHAYLIRLMENYVRALRHGTKFVFQSLPRLLTLWFEYGELLYARTSGTSVSSDDPQAVMERRVLSDMASVVKDAARALPAYEWLMCFPQVASRVCHPNPVVVKSVTMILTRVLAAYPTQAMWVVLGLSRSLNTQRKFQAQSVLSEAERAFAAMGRQDLATSFEEGGVLVDELIRLAGHDPQHQRKIHIRLSRLRSKILVPVQSAMTTLLPRSGLAPPDSEHSAFAPSSQVHIRAFSDTADVMMTKEKPKRIEIVGSDGKWYPFLCKREKTGDLRKDARMMEFNVLINKLLQKDREGRKRKLRLRTYAVVCLNEESGLMEWVEHTRAMRQLVSQIRKTERGYLPTLRLSQETKERYLAMQRKYAADPPAMATYYRRKILSLPEFTPRFHQWFYNNFADPTAWFEGRRAFARSAALWSMVGHIVGLGDRHGENILIDTTTGECVHVDFDCLFDKGLKLAKPEIVPFRLTPNLIDAFGITGVEGVFRKVAEVTMHLLRDNQPTLRSVLESFIHDPLVEWGRRGKATQREASAANDRGGYGTGGAGAKQAGGAGQGNTEAHAILAAIDDRLRGVYNLGAAIRPQLSASHLRLLPAHESLPLSVQGQVDKLIQEATSLENLAQMYIGWMPFL